MAFLILMLSGWSVALHFDACNQNGINDKSLEAFFKRLNIGEKDLEFTKSNHFVSDKSIFIKTTQGKNAFIYPLKVKTTGALLMEDRNKLNSELEKLETAFSIAPIKHNAHCYYKKGTCVAVFIGEGIIKKIDEEKDLPPGSPVDLLKFYIGQIEYLNKMMDNKLGFYLVPSDYFFVANNDYSNPFTYYLHNLNQVHNANNYYFKHALEIVKDISFLNNMKESYYAGKCLEVMSELITKAKSDDDKKYYDNKYNLDTFLEELKKTKTKAEKVCLHKKLITDQHGNEREKWTN